MLSPFPRVKNSIRSTREALYVNRKRLARLLGYTTTSHLSRWETGREIPTLLNALRLGYVLHTPVDVLFKGLRDEVVQEVRIRQVQAMAEEAGDEVDVTTA